MDRRYDRDFELPNAEQLARLADQYRGTPLYPRVALLWALRSDRYSSVAQLEQASGLAARTISRYLAMLRNEGYEALLASRRTSCRLSREQIELLKVQIHLGEISSVEHARRWVRKQFDVAYTYSGIYHLIGREFETVRELREKRRDRGKSAPNDPRGLAPRRLVEGLNRMKVPQDIDSGVDFILDFLYEVMQTARRIAVTVVPSATIGGKGGAEDRDRHAKLVYQDATSGKKVSNERVFSTGHASVDETRLHHVLTQMEAAGVYDPKHDCHVSRRYENSDGEDIGHVIVVFERRSDMERDAQILDILSPFLTFCFSSVLAVVESGSSGAMEWHRRIVDLAGEADLTAREKEVLLALISGKTHQRIADSLDISPSTVKHHLRSIYDKSGVSTAGELFSLLVEPIPQVTDEESRADT